MESIMDRATATAIKFLQRKGYDILDDGREGSCGIVARDDDAIAFDEVAASAPGEGFVDPAAGRARREAAAGEWLAAHVDAIGEGAFRFDDISLVQISSGRAMVRHHINSLGSMEG